MRFPTYSPEVAERVEQYPDNVRYSTVAVLLSRMARGGYFLMHDFNSTESDHATSRVANGFLADRAELLIEIPGDSDSVLFHKSDLQRKLT